MGTRPVVVGVDGSEVSLLAVEWAAMEAGRRSCPLRIVSAPAAMPRIRAYHANPETVATALRGISARALEAALARSEEVAPGLRVTTGMLGRAAGAGRRRERRGRVLASRGGPRGGRFHRDDPWFGEQVRRHPRAVPGRRGPAGDDGRPSRDRRRHPRPAGRRRHAGVRVRGSGGAWRGPSRGARLAWFPPRCARAPSAASEGARCRRPTRCRSQPRPSAP